MASPPSPQSTARRLLEESRDELARFRSPRSLAFAADTFEPNDHDADTALLTDALTDPASRPPKATPTKLVTALESALIDERSLARALEYRARPHDVVVAASPVCGQAFFAKLVRLLGCKDAAEFEAEFQRDAPVLESRALDSCPTALGDDQSGPRRVFRTSMTHKILADVTRQFQAQGAAPAAAPAAAAAAAAAAEDGPAGWTGPDLVVVVRNPVDLRQQWYEYVRAQYARSTGAVADFDEAYSADHFAHVPVTHAEPGMGADDEARYEANLYDWLQVKTHPKVFMILLEEFLAQPERVLDRLTLFLNHRFLEDHLRKRILARMTGAALLDAKFLLTHAQRRMIKLRFALQGGAGRKDVVAAMDRAAQVSTLGIFVADDTDGKGGASTSTSTSTSTATPARPASAPAQDLSAENRNSGRRWRLPSFTGSARAKNVDEWSERKAKDEIDEWGEDDLDESGEDDSTTVPDGDEDKAIAIASTTSTSSAKPRPASARSSKPRDALTTAAKVYIAQLWNAAFDSALGVHSYETLYTMLTGDDYPALRAPGSHSAAPRSADAPASFSPMTRRTSSFRDKFGLAISRVAGKGGDGAGTPSSPASAPAVLPPGSPGSARRPTVQGSGRGMQLLSPQTSGRDLEEARSPRLRAPSTTGSVSSASPMVSARKTPIVGAAGAPLAHPRARSISVASSVASGGSASKGSTRSLEGGAAGDELVMFSPASNKKVLRFLGAVSASGTSASVDEHDELEEGDEENDDAADADEAGSKTSHLDHYLDAAYRGSPGLVSASPAASPAVGVARKAFRF